MSDQFVAEIRIFGFNFAPNGWALCDGQLLPISQNTALFSLLGTQYGGDGKSTFALPNLQGSAAIQQGQGNGLSERFVGETGGSQTVTLNASEMPLHAHTLSASILPADSPNPTGAYTAAPGNDNLYAAPNGVQPMASQCLPAAGGSQPHNNMQPYLTMNFCIAMQGIFPPRS